jgi:hypothetical protein
MYIIAGVHTGVAQGRGRQGRHADFKEQAKEEKTGMYVSVNSFQEG